MTATWVDFFIMAGVFVLIATGALVWVLYFRKRGHKRRHNKPRHQRERRPANPTLAQTGGLPPPRPPTPDGTPSQTP
jgi:hypothetical protein